MFKKSQKLVVDERSGKINPYGVAMLMIKIMLIFAMIAIVVSLGLSLFA